MRTVSLAVLLIMLAALPGCGKKDDLDRPPDAVRDERIERDWNN